MFNNMDMTFVSDMVTIYVYFVTARYPRNTIIAVEPDSGTVVEVDSGYGIDYARSEMMKRLRLLRSTSPLCSYMYRFSGDWDGGEFESVDVYRGRCPADDRYDSYVLEGESGLEHIFHTGTNSLEISYDYAVDRLINPQKGTVSRYRVVLFETQEYVPPLDVFDSLPSWAYKQIPHNNSPNEETDVP